VTVAPPPIEALLASELEGDSRPAAVVLAGHNGSGKSTLGTSGSPGTCRFRS
jgi:predicted ATPase